jgi:hypothetical protein
MKIKVVDQDHPFYKPLWRRIALVAFTGAWAAYEIIVGRDPLWMVLTGGLCAYAAWNFLITWPKDKPAEGGPEAEK